MIGPRWLLVAALGGALIAGCGGGGSSTSGTHSASTSAATTSSAAATTSSTATTTGTSKSSPTTPNLAANPAALAEAVAVCKSIIARAPTLSASTKAKVESICDKAEHGDLAGARAAAKEVCTEVIDASPIPQPAKAQALAACKRAT
jgi:hypothetical protein